MVIEFLTFDVSPDIRDEWLEHEESHWSRYLERQAGFISKEMWVEDTDPGRVHAVIRWDSMQSWEAVPRDEITAVDDAMGDWCIQPTARAFRVVRDC